MIERLYDRIPDCKCKGKCAEYCGPVPFNKEEKEKVEMLASWEYHENIGFIPVGDGLTCAFLKNERCSIYEKRPLICRLFGASKGLSCRHGCKPTLRPKDEKRLLTKYRKTIEKGTKDVK